MNKKILMVAMAFAIAISVSMVGVDAGAKGEKGIIVGHAVEISTYVMKGLGDDTVKEMQNRASQGFPVGIIEEGTNKLWVCVYRNNAPASGVHPGNEKMNEFLGTQVVAQGLKFSSNGVNLIRFGNISEY